MKYWLRFAPGDLVVLVENTENEPCCWTLMGALTQLWQKLYVRKVLDCFNFLFIILVSLSLFDILMET